MAIRRWLGTIALIWAMSSIVVATDSAMHFYVVRFWLVTLWAVEFAVIVMESVPSVDMAVIAMIAQADMTVIVVWVIIPIPSRAIYGVGWQPEPIKYHRMNDIAWYNHVIVTIDVAATDNGNSGRYFVLAFDNDGGNVLIEVLTYNGLNDNHVCTFVFKFDNSEEINVAVVVQIEVRDTIVGVVQSTFKVFHIFRFAESDCYCL